jgi:hypothetical protein
MFKNEVVPWSYRDAEAGLRARRDALVAWRRAELAQMSGEVEAIYVSRWSRLVTGAAAVAGAAIMCGVAIETGLERLLGSRTSYVWQYTGDTLDARSPTLMLVITLAALPLVYLVARLLARHRFARLREAAVAPGGDVHADLERLARLRVGRAVALHADALARPSAAWPLLGTALLLPISLHLGVALAGTARFLDFDWWISLSVVVTAAAHAVYGTMSWTFARDLALGFAPSPWRPLGWVCLAGLFPGVVLYLVPPILIAMTAVVCVPVPLWWMKNVMMGERRALATWTTTLTATAT